MSYLDNGYNRQTSLDPLGTSVSHNQQVYGSVEARTGETRVGDHRVASVDRPSLGSHYLNSGASYLMQPNIDPSNSQRYFESEGGYGHLTSFAVPRTVNWPEKAPGMQTTDQYGGTKCDNNSDTCPDASESSFSMSSKLYPDQTKHSSFDTTLETMSTQHDSGVHYFGGETTVGSKDEVIKDLNLKLRVKEAQNESLENEIQKLKNSFNEALTFKQSGHKFDRENSHADSALTEIPTSVEQIFKMLSSSLRKKSEELEETKQTLECILTALAVSPTNSVTKYGRYDAEALAHKMVVRLETLTKENQEMARMLAYGRAKEVQIELQLAKMENRDLRERISEIKNQDGNPRT